MYYASPFTYLVDGMLSTGLANTKVVCSSIELRTLEPINGQTCGEFLGPYINRLGGYVTNPDASQGCEFCSASDTNVVLATLSSNYSNRWRNFGIMWAFITFNISAALFLYWLARVPKKQKVLDSPPTELASRVQTRASKPEHAVEPVRVNEEGYEAENLEEPKGVKTHDLEPESPRGHEEIEKI